jgi:hypothetical protein
MVVYNML